MSEGLATTFRVLTRTANGAAVRVLVSALDSPYEPIQEGALVALLTRRSQAGGREVLSRLHTLPDRWKEIIGDHAGRMTRTLRNAILGSDREMFVNGCRAAIWFHEFDMVPPLLSALEDRDQKVADRAAQTLLVLVNQLCDELAGSHDHFEARRRDPQLIRRQVLASLETSVKRLGRHGRHEVIEAFLLLVDCRNGTLREVLNDPHHVAFRVTVDVLCHSSREEVMQLLLSLIEVPHAPSAVISVLAKRSDLEFTRRLLQKTGYEPSAAVMQNLKQVRSIGWLQSKSSVVSQLDGDAQCAAVRLVMASSIPRLEAFTTIEYLLLQGKPGGRREAAVALAEFKGADANRLALRALNDADPQVQANIVVQLRRRGIPGIFPCLVKMADVPHGVVREAVREALEEFTFKRFVAAFDMLEDDVRRSTGMLVKKIDPETPALLRKELESPMRTRRLRGLAIAQTLDLGAPMEEVIIGLLKDEDHLVRVEAAALLARDVSEAGREALEKSLHDRSEAVREAARRGLKQQEEFTQWREAFADPRD